MSVVIPLTTIIWGKGSLVFNLVRGLMGEDHKALKITFKKKKRVCTFFTHFAVYPLE